MPTATAKPIKTAKYPGWDISKIGQVYLMTRPGGIFAISVTHSEAHGWEGVLLTRQRGGWAPAKTPYTHCPLGCTVECDRREKTIAKFQARPLTK